MDDEKIPYGVLEIAGVDVSSLLWEQDEIEQAIRELALYPQFHEHFKEAFGLINYATSFWLEELSYAAHAGSVIATMYRLRDPIDEHASYAKPSSLPNVIRLFIDVDTKTNDSQLTATYALIRAFEGVTALANWLFETEVSIYDLDEDLALHLYAKAPKQYAALAQEERLKDRDVEIKAREFFRECLGDAQQALMLADLCKDIENLDIAKKSFNVSSFLHELLSNAFSAKAFQRASSAGKANSKPNSEKQLNAAQTFGRVTQSAKRHITLNPTISGADLVKALVEKDGIATAPTVRKYLRKGHFLPR
ncbi:MULTISPECIES: hypothetical protein [Pseudomonas]|uniref:Uncharacterized protein n=1 Tax=Pseudomonas sp. WC2401 TaxID=3234143 RepID=A0AB39X0T7_9PSED